MNAAVDGEILKRNRFREITIKKEEIPVEIFLTPAQLAVVIAAIKEENNPASYVTAALLFAHTGMRIGEALGVQWCDVDFENGTITIKHTRDCYGSRTPKTDNSYRTIAIPKVLIHELQKHKSLNPKIPSKI